ncbi:MAG TPA: 4-vinyl reductase [Anaerolineales bacterium]|nr:4-vinyl reductase [Anaerolineae bacterium]HIQ02044.1 4-vinyl reductase [Anaerolineales bacterium]
MRNAKEDSAAKQIEYYFPNKMGRILLLAMEEVMGRNGVNAVLNLANLRHLLGKYPPNNFDREFSFGELSRLLGALDEMYGVRGGRGLALRVGRSCFRFGIKDFGPMLGIADLAFRVMPLTMKLKIGFEVFAEVFNKFSDHHVRLGENEDSFLWTIEQCGVCWGRTAAAPCCHLAVGILQEALYWVSGGRNFDAEEVSCIAAGDRTCTIQIDKQPVD